MNEREPTDSERQAAAELFRALKQTVSTTSRSIVEQGASLEARERP
jgi:hypothetical protein